MGTASVAGRTELARATFTPSQAPGSQHVTLEEPHVRGIAAQLGFFAPGSPITSVVIPEISDKVSGLWSLWRIALDGGGSRARRILPLFVSDDGRVLGPTARAVWERSLELDTEHARLRPAATGRRGGASATRKPGVARKRQGVRSTRNPQQPSPLPRTGEAEVGSGHLLAAPRHRTHRTPAGA